MPTIKNTPRPSRKITTSDLAAYLGCQPTTIRRGLCVNGHYLGLVPTKLPNGRLLWSEAPVFELLGD
ncbi:monooxygenase [Desulforhopalus sp. IMCC35007]|nr:monooxygenase [Desulforhopalus sp. IMCC35007]